jgi:hypothetical protein
LTSYPVRYRFKQNNVYDDAKANPCEHIIAFYQFARFFEALGLPIFNCFPLRRTWIPGYATTDSKLLCQNILGHVWTTDTNKMNLWAEMINMDSTVLKSQELGMLRFHGTIQTGGTLKKIRDRKY